MPDGAKKNCKVDHLEKDLMTSFLPFSESQKDSHRHVTEHIQIPRETSTIFHDVNKTILSCICMNLSFKSYAFESTYREIMIRFYKQKRHTLLCVCYY